MNIRKIYKMKIHHITDHTPTVRQLDLRLESDLATDSAENEFKFKAGQFAMLHVPATDPLSTKPLLRAYSIASGDQDTRGFTLLFKHVAGGVASAFVWNLKGDETLDFTGPFGRVFFKEPPTKQVVFLSTGTGISQHLSYLASKGSFYPNVKYQMLIGVRNESEIYYQKEIEAISKKNHLSHFNFEFVLSRPSETWTGKKGYVQNFIEDFDFINTATTFYLCGNGGMIKEVKAKLAEKSFDPALILSEAFD
jgi:NAD(P)H-flavin reductase